MEYRKDGMKYYIGVGKAAIMAPATDPMYIESRQNAYEMALMNAKKVLLKV